MELISKGTVSIVEQFSLDQAHVLRHQSEREQRGPCTKNVGAVKDVVECLFSSTAKARKLATFILEYRCDKGSLLGRLQ